MEMYNYNYNINLYNTALQCGTPDSLLLTHGLSPTTGQHGGRYDPQPVTRSSE